MKNIKSVSPYTLAGAFCKAIRRQLSPSQLASVVRKNRTTEYRSSCASHDYCDANVLMDAAFKSVLGYAATDTQPEVGSCMSSEANTLWNQAWNIARQSEFSMPYTLQFKPYSGKGWSIPFPADVCGALEYLKQKAVSSGVFTAKEGRKIVAFVTIK